jgi:hypothetical protein
MSRCLKKLSHKYEYLKLELEEYEEKSEVYTSEWSKLFGKFFIDRNKEMWLNEETGELRKDPPSEEEEESNKEAKPEKLKKLYRKLSTFLHPDKGGSPEVFTKLKEFYESKNLLELFKLAGENGIEVELEEEDRELIEVSCSNISKKIEGVQSTLSWLYFTGDKRKKLQVIAMVENELGVKIPKEDYPEELRD